MGTRYDLAQVIAMPMFWMKVLFPAAVACAGFATLARLARPGVSARAGQCAIAAPILLLWLMAIMVYADALPSERAAMVWGQSWRICTLSVLMISVPVFVAAFLALRRLAPTRLVQTGARAGVLSGAAVAANLCVSLPEDGLAVHGRLVRGGHRDCCGHRGRAGPATCEMVTPRRQQR